MSQILDFGNLKYRCNHEPNDGSNNGSSHDKAYIIALIRLDTLTKEDGTYQ